MAKRNNNLIKIILPILAVFLLLRYFFDFNLASLTKSGSLPISRDKKDLAKKDVVYLPSDPWNTDIAGNKITGGGKVPTKLAGYRYVDKFPFYKKVFK